jgi:hypothetical protein
MWSLFSLTKNVEEERTGGQPIQKIISTLIERLIILMENKL